MNIVLIGYRGTGKSTIGRALAAKLGRAVISTDQEIVRRAGRTIPQIVADHGWEYFRDLESEVCKDLSERDNLVVDTGGGAILRQHNVTMLKQNGLLFWLTASVKTIGHRIGEDTQRPSLTGTKSFVEEIQEVLTARSPSYRAAADHILVTDNRSVSQLVEDIVHLLKAE